MTNGTLITVEGLVDKFLGNILYYSLGASSSDVMTKSKIRFNNTNPNPKARAGDNVELTCILTGGGPDPDAWTPVWHVVGFAKDTNGIIFTDG